MKRSHLLSHAVGWFIAAALSFLQPFGLIAADTKHDLVADPGGFLAGALDAWTDVFTLGQLQNQAYGYLFPQGLFFLLTEPLPDWIAQRLWWTLVLGVGYSGFLLLLRRLAVGSFPFQILAAGLFALSPRTLTTLTVISSETWPVMLAPWVMLPLLGRLTIRAVALAVLPVAAMGAVNATATLAACVPAGLLLLWRILRRDRGSWLALLTWLLGCLLVSIWWIGPLLVLGRYAAPFTDFIESSYVTTRWLNPLEILRGTTSWSPFVDTERTAGNLLVSEPVFVLATVLVAALGLAGLVSLIRRGMSFAGLWVAMLFLGLLILGMGHGPLSSWWLAFLDGVGAPLRNLHKFDPLVRIPLLVGVAALGSHLPVPSSPAQLWWRKFPGQRHAVAGLVLLIAVVSVAPAWSGRMLPRGAYEQVPQYWAEAAEFLNENAAGTRTLIYPEASFARQEWGWTRDEPAQPLLEVPWAVRDAVPLIDPEAIRGLDGIMAVLEQDPETGSQALRRLGIGAVLVRHDLLGNTSAEEETTVAEDAAAELPGQRHSFGEVDVIILDESADLALTSADPVRVAGGGESLALLDAVFGPGPRELVADNAEIVTDTPMLTVRNYGTLQSPVSAPLASLAEGADVRNTVKDYPSAGPLTRVEEHGGQVVASSSAADATSFGGADPSRSMTAAVDGDPDTAWYPTPGVAEGQWLELRGHFPDPVLEVTATADTTLAINSGEASVRVEVAAGEPAEVVVPGGATDQVRVTLTAAAGIAEIGLAGHDIERVVTVPDTSPAANHFLFQQLFVDTGVIIREFTAPRDMTVELQVPGDEPVLLDDTEYTDGDSVELTEGTHRLRTDAAWVSLKEPDFEPSPAFSDTDGTVLAAAEERLLLTGRSANPGLQASLGQVMLEPVVKDAGTQAFVIPAGAAGTVEFNHAGNPPYRASLFLGGAIGLLTALGCLLLGVLPGRRRTVTPKEPAPRVAFGPVARWLGVAVGVAALGLVIGWPVVPLAVMAWAILRFTTIPAWLLAGGPVLIAGTWLSRAPWPNASYAGDEPIVAWVCGLGVVTLLFAAAELPGLGTRRADEIPATGPLPTGKTEETA